MNNQFFDQKIFNNLENPMQKLIELNVKTMQKLPYMKPLDLLSLKKPEELLEKQVELFVQNGHIALNYMRETFNILEGQWLNISHSVGQNTNKFVKKASTTLKKRPVSAKKQSSATKKSGLTTKSVSRTKSAKSSLKKNVKSATRSSAAKVKSASGTAKKMPLVGELTDKHLDIHHLGKSNPFSN